MSRRWERDRSKEGFWRSMVRQWQRSGQPIRAFCAAQHLSEPSFYAWRRIIAKRDQEVGRQRQCKAAETNRGAALFVPVRLSDPVPGSLTMEVVLGCGRRLRVPVGFDGATLRQLLAILEEAPSC